jgi:HEPN domain-containing protein
MEQAIAGLSHEAILALEGYPDGSDAPVYLSGSVVGPFANAWSDIDVFVLAEREPVGPFTLTSRTHVASQHQLEGRRVDYEFWRPAHVRALAERLNRLELGTATHAARKLFSYDEEAFLHRLRTGLPLLNADRLHATQALFDFAKLARFQAQEVIRILDAVYEDACGMLETGDLDSAVFSARSVVELSVDAYLHARGNTDPTAKWRSRRLAVFDDGSAFHREIADAYWRLEFPACADRRAAEGLRRDYAQECLAFSRRVTSWIQG